MFWSWSDEAPLDTQEAEVRQGFADAEFTVPLIASAEYKSTPTLGFSGMKEGPYNWFPPSYAYSLNCSSSSGNGPCTRGSFTNRGGAWAFDSESSPGSTVPPTRRWAGPATLPLTLGAPASVGAFQPGVARDYTASTTADVVSTAGDAALSVADPSTTAPGHLVNGAFALPQPLQVLAADGTFTR